MHLLQQRRISAIAHGISHLVGSIEVGKVADLVMYRFSEFGARPKLVIKGGIIVQAQMGDANASIPTTEPLLSRPQFGRTAASSCALALVSRISKDMGLQERYGLKKRVEAVKKCREVGKKDMKWNDWTGKVDVDPELYAVTVDGKHFTCEPAKEVALSTGYYLF